jgi:hypothetical protein
MDRNAASSSSMHVERVCRAAIGGYLLLRHRVKALAIKLHFPNEGENEGRNERGDVPGWVLVVLMTTGLVTAIWTIAAPRLTAIVRNSLDSMNGIR